MVIDVKMPQLGESVSEGTVTKWLVREGDVIHKDQPLLEVATDKADTEVPAPAGGRVVKLLVRENDVVPVHSVLLQLDDSAQPAAAAAAPAPAAAPAAPAASRSATGAALATPTARKAALENSVDIDAVQGTGERGRITKDDVLRAADAPPRTEPPMSPAMRAIADKAMGAPAAPAPPARTAQLAQMINAGGGFVPPVPGVGYGAFKVPPYRPNEGDKVVPFTRRRRITADHMAYSKVTSPHVVTVAEVDLHKAARLREANKDRYKKEGLSLTMLAFVTVAVARALRETPDLNARVLDDAYVVFKDVNIGVAVDSPEGLVVPVVRRADELGVRGIVRAIDDLARRAKNGKITVDDLSGATFSVSNPGLKGNLFGGAIISQPNVGILRMGEIQKRVVVVEGPDGEDHMAIHPVMYMALSYDHRIVDGVAANSFLWRVTELLEKAEFEV
ncbi:MAG: 2-oxo acid dehydrogenase subunit E2 [Myxococcales bacterium]|nr:2-oxo acid dehydrogenase subunit E2 [Myxococcales bacterium]